MILNWVMNASGVIKCDVLFYTLLLQTHTSLVKTLGLSGCISHIGLDMLEQTSHISKDIMLPLIQKWKKRIVSLFFKNVFFPCVTANCSTHIYFCVYCTQNRNVGLGISDATLLIMSTRSVCSVETIDFLLIICLFLKKPCLTFSTSSDRLGGFGCSICFFCFVFLKKSIPVYR